ncbi:MAG: hypothetical protein IIC67_05680 [Thaumarchaeota archaeon]|nr:hypothetical protein [Nitrososphaerota archaeon]
MFKSNFVGSQVRMGVNWNKKERKEGIPIMQIEIDKDGKPEWGTQKKIGLIQRNI